MTISKPTSKQQKKNGMILILLIILFFFLMPLMVWQEDIFKVLFPKKYLNNNHEKRASIN